MCDFELHIYNLLASVGRTHRSLSSAFSGAQGEKCIGIRRVNKAWTPSFIGTDYIMPCNHKFRTNDLDGDKWGL
jgi:hypothetical protein